MLNNNISGFYHPEYAIAFKIIFLNKRIIVIYVNEYHDKNHYKL
jgi:hypothetical protein